MRKKGFESGTGPGSSEFSSPICLASLETSTGQHHGDSVWREKSRGQTGNRSEEGQVCSQVTSFSTENHQVASGTVESFSSTEGGSWQPDLLTVSLCTYRLHHFSGVPH